MSDGTEAVEPVPESPASGDAEDTARPSSERPKRKYSEKRIKIFVLVAVVGVVVVILLWGMVPDRIYEVKEVVDGLDDHVGERINVKGVVSNWEMGMSTFTLVDSNNANLSIQVEHPGPIPEGFGVNVTVVIKGIFHRSGQTYSIDSDEIQIGCPSKY